MNNKIDESYSVVINCAFKVHSVSTLFSLRIANNNLADYNLAKRSILSFSSQSLMSSRRPNARLSEPTEMIAAISERALDYLTLHS